MKKPNVFPLIDDLFSIEGAPTAHSSIFDTSSQEENKLASLIRHRIANPMVPKESSYSAPAVTTVPAKANPSNSSSLIPKALVAQAFRTQVKKTHFSSRPDLRKMMSEYNRPKIKSTLFKVGSKEARASQNDFQPERLDFIEIPSIPGRVLRPQRNS